MGAPWSARVRDLRWGLAVAAWPWLVARGVVLGALALAHEIALKTHPSPATLARVHEGLLGWDAGWYASIARVGYAGAGHSSLRFFPLVPLLAHLVSVLPGVDAGTGLLVVANVSALLGLSLLALLVKRETGEEGLARTAVWIFAVAPAAYTYVMGYAEATLLVFTVGTFLALRSRRWWIAALLGFLAGLTRPLGIVLGLPALIEALRGLRVASRGELAGRLAAVVAPVAGTAAFLGYVAWRYGGFLTPLRIQTESRHRGGFADPISTLAHDASYLIHHRHIGSALHLPWAIVMLVLLVVAFRTWPAAYGAFAAAVLAIAATAPNMDSFERYSLSAFPLVLAGAAMSRSRRVEVPVIVLLTAAMVGYALLAFLNITVP